MKISNIILLGAILSFIACSSKEEKTEVPVEVAEKKVEAPVVKKGPEWTYAGAFGPKFWGDLDSSYSLCKDGNHQSPINLIWKQPAQPNPFTPNYVDAKARVVDSGSSIHVHVDGNNSIKMRNSVYTLSHLKFHSPSEHQFSGKSYPLEIQILHRNDKGFVAMVALMVKEGKPNSLAETLIKNLPPAKNSEQEIANPINLVNLLPATRTLYNYAGSLTYPPCTEGVNWIVMNTPIEFSKEQIEAIVNRYPANNRPIQPLNDRVMVNY